MIYGEEIELPGQKLLQIKLLQNHNIRVLKTKRKQQLVGSGHVIKRVEDRLAKKSCQKGRQKKTRLYGVTEDKKGKNPDNLWEALYRNGEGEYG